MKITFPHMGQLAVMLKILLRRLDIPFVEPSEDTERMLEEGCRYAPEGVCLPMKLILGEFLDAAARGADTAIFFGGNGPCRFGYFGALFQTILQERGYDMKVILLEAPEGDWGELLRRIDEACGHKMLRLAAALIGGLWYLPRLDRWEEELYDGMAAAAARGDKLACKRIERLREETQEALEKAGRFRELGRLLKKGEEKLAPFAGTKKDQVRIGIVGDIYSVIDTRLNRGLQWELARRGILTRRSMTLTGYLKDGLGLRSSWRRAARPYLKRRIGGFAWQTVGWAAWMAREKWDGILQVYPLNCMPEAVAESILPAISEEYEIPVLRLVLDEHSGEAGYLTRTEAFADLLERRREQRAGILSGN